MKSVSDTVRHGRALYLNHCSKTLNLTALPRNLVYTASAKLQQRIKKKQTTPQTLKE